MTSDKQNEALVSEQWGRFKTPQVQLHVTSSHGREMDIFETGTTQNSAPRCSLACTIRSEFWILAASNWVFHNGHSYECKKRGSEGGGNSGTLSYKPAHPKEGHPLVRLSRPTSVAKEAIAPHHRVNNASARGSVLLHW